MFPSKYFTQIKLNIPCGSITPRPCELTKLLCVQASISVLLTFETIHRYQSLHACRHKWCFPQFVLQRNNESNNNLKECNFLFLMKLFSIQFIKKISLFSVVVVVNLFLFIFLFSICRKKVSRHLLKIFVFIFIFCIHYFFAAQRTFFCFFF